MIGNGLPERIVAKLLMIVEILVAASDGEDSLSQKSTLRMQDEGGLAWIGNNTIEGIDESELLIDLSEQQRAGIGGDGPARKIGAEIATIEAGKWYGCFVTLCHREGSWPSGVEVC